MTIYLRIYESDIGIGSEAWNISESTAIKLGVTNAVGGPGSSFTAKSGENIFDVIKDQASAWFEPNGESPFHPVTLASGEYYPRIARPSDHSPFDDPDINPVAWLNYHGIAESIGQLSALTHQLQNICQTVHPVDANLDTFGHDIRNLLILAATEVETHWRGVLEANGVKKDRPSTKQYIYLRDAMRLHEYEVILSQYPWLLPITPFRDWDIENPTKSLSWYHAYNMVKHNRQGEFARATLRHTIDAVAACAILQVAQYGVHEDRWERSDVKNFFTLFQPKWPLADVYVHPYGEGESRRQKYFPFAMS